MALKRPKDKDFEIIVKRRRKSGHEENHSGAWKVAFADFTMAMMALFMVLWVVTPQNIKQTTAADQLSNPLVDGGAGVFDGNSSTPLELPGLPVQNEQTKDENHHDSVKYNTPGEMQDLAELMKSLAMELDAQANIEVQVVPQGLRVLIKDDKERFMFERSSVRLHPHFSDLLQRLAGVLANVDNKLIVSGHTDATAYRSINGYNNWNLSGDRALRARQVMVEAGLKPSAVLQVAAQADVMPLRPEAPEDGINRRIEILLLTTKAEGLYRELFGNQQARVDYSQESAELVMPATSKVSEQQQSL